ncbi:hypothetical protein BH11PLA1_BH11PLA1_07910 [soil metagenome]
MAQDSFPAESPGTLVTSVPAKWITWQVAFLVVLVGFGIYCYVEGAFWYPARGIEDASAKQHVYLQSAAKVRRLDAASIPDPQAELERLEARDGELHAQSNAETASGQSAAFELARLEWLRSLKLVGRVAPEFTTMSDPSATKVALDEKWASTENPKPLQLYDIPLQWAMLAVCALLSLGVLIVMLKTLATRYRYEPARKTLTLPKGERITPADIREVDKRKWHKLRCTVVLKDGRTYPMDLLRYVPLESWILDMESAPDGPAPAGASEPGDAPAESIDTGAPSLPA